MCFESEINLITSEKYKINSISDAIKIVTENCDGKKRNFPPVLQLFPICIKGKIIKTLTLKADINFLSEFGSEDMKENVTTLNHHYLETKMRI